MEGLPLLPGYTFKDITATKFHLQQKFDFKNGYRIPRNEWTGIGKRPLDAESIAYYAALEPVKFDPTLTYGRVKTAAAPQVVPHWVTYDKKALTFTAYFHQAVLGSPDESYRVRHVNIFYFLEDDTITVIEPQVENCGFPQGRIVRRGRIPKHVSGSTCWHWKDLNVGIDLTLFGVVYRTVACDPFTREYLESQGVEVNATEELPPDPYTVERRLRVKPPAIKMPSVDDKRKRFLANDGRILRFYAVWDNTDAGERKTYAVYYYLADDCVEVKELADSTNGSDPCPLLLRRTKLPKNWKQTPTDFPLCYMERSDAEVAEYYSPVDFQIGNTIFILGRRFLLYDCDVYTRNFYKQHNMEQREAIQVFTPPPPPPHKPVPPHTGIGAPEDSLQNCFSLHPKPPKRDFVRYCFNANKYLRYMARMEAVHPEDEGRQFVFMYHLADGTLRVVEPPVDNSGFVSGVYLSARCLPKPGTDLDNPEYYTPADFYIGATVSVYQQRFHIVDADLRVYRYMQDNADKFPAAVVANLRNHMVRQGRLEEDCKERSIEAQREFERNAQPDCDRLPLPPLPIVS